MMADAGPHKAGMSKPQRTPKGLLSLNIDLINCAEEEAQLSYQLDENAYRQEGVSIGCDYLRLEGVTITRGELAPSKLCIEEIIGKGAFSTVRRAQWRRNETTVDVAVKECSLLESSPQRRHMLLRELRSLCSVTSPTLVQLHGAFLHDNDCSHAVTMVLEFMDKGSLEDFLVHYKEKHGAALPESITAAISYQILCGLAYLHAPERRLLHRDLKPANVLLQSNGVVKLSDFGMAKILREEDSLNFTVLGTTKFMAPERLRAKPYGRPSDVWSLGLVIWACTTADETTPWCDDVHSVVDLLVSIEETSILDVLEKRQQRQSETSNSATTISKGLQEIIAGCLHVEPRKRIPAIVLLRSPWFSSEQKIGKRDDAAKQTCDFFLQK